MTEYMAQNWQGHEEAGQSPEAMAAQLTKLAEHRFNAPDTPISRTVDNDGTVSELIHLAAASEREIVEASKDKGLSSKDGYYKIVGTVTELTPHVLGRTTSAEGAITYHMVEARPEQYDGTLASLQAPEYKPAYTTWSADKPPVSVTTRHMGGSVEHLRYFVNVEEPVTDDDSATLEDNLRAGTAYDPSKQTIVKNPIGGDRLVSRRSRLFHTAVAVGRTLLSNKSERP